MKTRINCISRLILMLGALISCSRIDGLKNDITLPERVFLAYTDASTRAVVQEDGRVSWSPNDEIIVYKSGTHGLFTAQLNEPSVSASFSGTFNSNVIESDLSVAAFPSSSAYSYNDGILSLGVGSYKTYLSSQSRVNAFVSVAISDDDTFRFHNLCGGICFSCSSYGITQVSFTARGGVSVSGRITVKFNEEGDPSITSISNGRSDMVILPGGEDECFIPGKKYYVPILPCTLSEGFNLGVTAYGKAYSMVDKTPREIKRSVIANLGNIDRFFDNWFIPEAVDLGLPSGVLWANVNYGAYFIDQFDFGAIHCTESTSIKSWGYDKDGGEWRRPTFAEWKELQNECTWKSVEVQTITRGYEIISKTQPNKKIFLHINPRNANNLYWAGTNKCLSLELNYPFYGFSFIDSNVKTEGMIRPVCKRDDS